MTPVPEEVFAMSIGRVWNIMPTVTNGKAHEWERLSPGIQRAVVELAGSLFEHLHVPEEQTPKATHNPNRDFTP